MEEDVNAFSQASAYANLGYCRLEQGKHEEALALFDRAEGLFQDYSPDDRRNVSNIATWRAQAYAALGKEAMAKKYFLQAFDFASEEEDNKKLSNICKQFAAFYASIGNYQKAYEFQQQHSKYSEQFVQKVHEQKRWELEAKFNVEMEQKEAAMLRLEASKLQLKALRAQMNPHFMYNALNGIQNYITSNKGKSAAKYLAKFSMLMRKSLNYSDLETISLEKELDFLQDYLFINKKLRFGDALNYEVVVDEDIEDDIIGVPTMIIQPYVENAIEHGLRTKREGHILIHLSMQDEDTILCVIEDDGIGLEASKAMQSQDPKFQNHRSRGTSITEKRLQLLHNAGDQEVFVDTKDRLDEQGNLIGTRVEIQIPVIDLFSSPRS
jgi:sensor histidine kinase YesM